MKELIFTIFKYKVTKLSTMQLELFTDGQKLKPMQYETKEQFFESFLPEKEKIVDLWEEIRKTKKEVTTVEKESHNNVIMEHRNNVIIMAVQANGTKTIFDENWSKRPEPNHPSCMVIFDNREGHQFMAIENAAMDPDKTAKIIQNSFNYALNRYGYGFEVNRLIRTLPFLEAVREIRDKLHDHINKLVFDFDKNMEQQKELSGKFVYALKEWIGSFADSGQIAANISNDNQLFDSIVTQDFELMAELCASNKNYNLLVKFSHFGIFRYGKDIKAQFGLDNDVLERFFKPKVAEPTQLEVFERREQEPKITLYEWLNDVKTIYVDYEEEALSVRKRGRTGGKRL